MSLAVTVTNSKQLGRPVLGDINLEFILKLKINRNDWLQAANHCAYFEFETALKFYNLVVRNCHTYIFTDFILLLLMHDCELASHPIKTVNISHFSDLSSEPVGGF